MLIIREKDGFQIKNNNGEVLINKLHLVAGVNGQVVEANNWQRCRENEYESKDGDIYFLVKITSVEGKLFLESQFSNEGDSPLEVDFLRWSRMPGADSFAIPGQRLRLYREGWIMTSACGSVGYGETDFSCDPNYLPFAVSAPERFAPPKANRFTSEYVTCLMPEDGDSLLAGFVTTADRVCRFEIELGEKELTEFHAVSCGDKIPLLPGETFQAEELLLLSGSDVWELLKIYAKIWGNRMQVRCPAHTPKGWCSWYYYFSKITEADVLENLAYIKEHRHEWPLEYMQIDHGYEAAMGDWLVTNEKFPHGLAFIAEQIHAAGIKPGLWLAPFMVQERSSLLIEHPDYVVHNSQGEIAWTTEWAGSRVAVLDGTHPGAQAYLKETFKALARIGFEYVKLDFLMYACTAKDGHFYDRKATRAQALRRGLAAIREGFGPDRFIMSCTAVLGPTAGLVDAERIATDITPYWRSEKGENFAESLNVPNVCRNVINRRYMHQALWLNDPDVHIARVDNNRLTEEEIRLWTSALWLTGGVVMLCDRFETLAPERAKLSQLLLRQTDAFCDVRPLDFRENTMPTIWFGRFAQTGAPVYGFFNFDEKSHQFTIRHDGPETEFKEHWTGQLLKTDFSMLKTEVPPHSCRLFFGVK